MKHFLIVALGSALGGSLRYLLGNLIKQPTGFPYGTLIINLLGCLIIGALLGISVRPSSPLSSNLMLFLITGLCGGFTTFSTFSRETLTLILSHQYLLALIYVLASVIGGLALTALAYLLTKP